METQNIAFVLVRNGSKGIPGKNVKPFYVKPLIFQVLDTLINSKFEISIIYNK